MIVDILGYIGFAGLIIGIILNRSKKYIICSDIALVVGQVTLGINCWYLGAIPAALVNAILGPMSVYNLIKDVKNREKA